MNREIELQRIRSLHRTPETSAAAQPLFLSPVYYLALVLGFSFVALGYAVSHTPSEKLAAWLGRPSVERSATTPALGGSVSGLAKTW